MRKKLFALLIGILAVTLLLTACAGVNLTLTFEVDGEAYATVTTSGQEAVQMPKNPVKEGYVFDGWYWDKDVWEKPFTANSLLETPLSDNMTVYAKWLKEAEEHVHSYGEWTVETAATCTEEGTEKRICSVCDTEETRVIEKLPHNFGEWTVVTAATCTEEGAEKRVCECGEEETRVIEKLPHNFGEWTEVTAATCTAEGTEKRVCECGEEETRVIEKLPHNFGEWTEVTAATCTAEGTEKRVCDVCEEEETRVIEKLPHSFGEWTVETAATCTAEGTEKRICSICDTEETHVIEKLPHTYEVQHDETNHWKECSVCHEEIDKAAHSYGEWTVETPATCTSEGTEKRVCECGEAETRVIAIKAHDYITKYDQGNHWLECTVCGEKKDEAAHTYENDVCTVCGRIYGTEGLSYTKINGGYEVSGIGTAKVKNIEIPSTYQTEPVIGVGSSAFYNCNSLVSVEIPNSVTSIGYGAFEGCSSLVSIEIPNSVTNIGSDAFRGCSSLESVVIGNGVTSIGSTAFRDCSSLTKVEISDIAAWCGIKFGDYSANPLYYAKHLYLNGEEVTELVIPEGVTSIGSSAFYNCSSLVSVEIPSGVTYIGSDAFSYCSSLTIYAEASAKPSGWNSSWNYSNCPVVWDYKNNDVASNGFIYTVQNGIRYSLKDGAATVVRQSRNITTANIPSEIVYKDNAYKVTSIDSKAFYECYSLVSVVIPDSVTSIGDYAFNGCSSIETITVAEGNTTYHSAGNCIIETETKTLIVGCKNSIIPTDGSVTSIGKNAFYGCSSLVSVEIPRSVTSIGSYAFYNCSSLVSVEIPSGVTSIGSYAFSECSSLVSVVIPDSVTSIGLLAFSNCSSLVSVEIPSSVTSIGDGAFYDCSSLVSIAIPSSVTSIGIQAFYNCSSLESVVIGNGVTSIGSSAFSSCSSLTKVEISDIAAWCGIKFGDYSANPLSYAKHLYINGEEVTELVIPEGVTSVGSYAFSGCSSLVSVVIPSGVTSIGYGAFYNCSSLESIEYDGTKEEWIKKITKGDSWNYNTGNYTVTCTDGTLSK